MACDVDEVRIRPEGVDPFASVRAIGQDDSHRTGMLVVAGAKPGNSVGVVKIIVLIAEAEGLADGDEFIDQEFVGVERDFSAFIEVAGLIEIIAEEDAGIAFTAEEDEGVRQRFKPRFDPRFKTLAGLGVVVIDEGDGLGGLLLRQRVIEDRSQVVTISRPRSIAEAVVERDIEEGHHACRVADILVEIANILRPVFAEAEEFAAEMDTEMVEPIAKKGGADVFAGIDAKAVDAGGIDNPAAPVAEFAVGHGGVDIAGHEIVVVAVFMTDFGGELFVFKAETIFAAALGMVLIEAYGVEMPPVPFVGGVLARPAWEVEAGPIFDGVPVADGAVAIVPINLLGQDVFGVVAAVFVIEDYVGIDLQAGGLGGGDGGEELCFSPVFGWDGSFLVELAEVEKVVAGVADVVGAATSFVGGGHPDAGKTGGVQFLGVILQEVPENTAIGVIPLEKLHHYAVFDGHLGSFHDPRLVQAD